MQREGQALFLRAAIVAPGYKVPQGGCTPPVNPKRRDDSLQVRFQIIRNARIDYVGESQSCMVSKLRMIWNRPSFCSGALPRPVASTRQRKGLPRTVSVDARPAGSEERQSSRVAIVVSALANRRALPRSHGSFP